MRYLEWCERATSQGRFNESEGLLCLELPRHPVSIWHLRHQASHFNTSHLKQPHLLIQQCCNDAENPSSKQRHFMAVGTTEQNANMRQFSMSDAHHPPENQSKQAVVTGCLPCCAAYAKQTTCYMVDRCKIAQIVHKCRKPAWH